MDKNIDEIINSNLDIDNKFYNELRNNTFIDQYDYNSDESECNSDEYYYDPDVGNSNEYNSDEYLSVDIEDSNGNVKTSVLYENIKDSEKDNIVSLMLYYSREIPYNINKFKNLKKLICYKSDCLSIKESIGNLTNLTHLDISGCNIYYNINSKGLSKLINLKHLNMSYNSIDDINLFISNLINLEYLNVSHNYIDNLIIYSNSNIHIDKKENTLNTLKKLKTLIISYNQLKQIFDKELYLPNLEYLDCGHNMLQYDIINYKSNELIKIHVLNLNETNLNYFPSFICDLVNLKKLYISHNHIKIISKQIYKLTNLIHLDLRYNNLYNFSIPKGFKKLISLNVLNILNNHITKYPYVLSHLKNLKYLYTDKIVVKDIFKHDIYNNSSNIDDNLYVRYKNLKNIDTIIKDQQLIFD